MAGRSRPSSRTTSADRPGNTLGPIRGSLNTVVTGHCALRFVAQPGDASRGAQIRADDFGGFGSTNFVMVEAVDGARSRELPAPTPGLLLSLNLGPDPLQVAPSGQRICPGSASSPPTAEWYDFRLFSTTSPNFSRDMTVFATYTKASKKNFPAPSSLEICFASPHTFITKSGAAAQAFDYDGDPANGAEGFVGLLPNSPQVNNPCVDKRGGLNGGAIVTFLVPAAWSDPRYH
jgi:hypothetical protein